MHILNLIQKTQNTMNTNNSNTDNSRRDFIRQSTMVAAGAMLLPRLALANVPPGISSSLPDDR